MKKDKTPKTAAAPIVEKQPRAIVVPNYKLMHPVWQIGILDLDGKWGYKEFNKQIDFIVSEQLLEYLVENDLNSLYEALDVLQKKERLTLQGFFSQLSSLSSEDCPPKVLKFISQEINNRFFETKLFPKLKEFEQLTWDEIEKQTYGKSGKSKHHAIQTNSLVKEAQERLKKLKQDDVDEVFSLRLEGKLRVFGIRDNNCLKILWVDLNHEVCESNIKHT